MGRTNKLAWFVFAFLAIGVGLYPMVYFFVAGKFGLLYSKSDALLANTLWNIGFYGHITFGGLALLTGWSQFSKRLRNKRLQLHRNLGKNLCRFRGDKWNLRCGHRIFCHRWMGKRIGFCPFGFDLAIHYTIGLCGHSQKGYDITSGNDDLQLLRLLCRGNLTNMAAITAIHLGGVFNCL